MKVISPKLFLGVVGVLALTVSNRVAAQNIVDEIHAKAKNACRSMKTEPPKIGDECMLGEPAPLTINARIHYVAPALWSDLGYRLRKEKDFFFNKGDQCFSAGGGRITVTDIVEKATGKSFVIGVYTALRGLDRIHPHDCPPGVEVIVPLEEFSQNVFNSNRAECEAAFIDDIREKIDAAAEGRVEKDDVFDFLIGQSYLIRFDYAGLKTVDKTGETHIDLEFGENSETNTCRLKGGQEVEILNFTEDGTYTIVRETGAWSRSVGRFFSGKTGCTGVELVVPTEILKPVGSEGGT